MVLDNVPTQHCCHCLPHAGSCMTTDTVHQAGSLNLRAQPTTLERWHGVVLECVQRQLHSLNADASIHPQTWALPAAFPLHIRQLHRTESCLCIQQQLQLSARPPPACQMICCCTNCSQTVAAHHAPNECSTALLQQCCRLGSSPRISCAPDAATCPFLSNTLLQTTSHDIAFDTLLPTTSHHRLTPCCPCPDTAYPHPGTLPSPAQRGCGVLCRSPHPP